MPIQLPNFQRIGYEEANPMLRGIQGGIGIAQNFQMFPQDLQKAILANQISKVQAQYAQPMAEQRLIQSKQKSEWDPRRWQSEIGLQGAQTNKMNTMTPLEAQEMQLKNKNYQSDIQSQIAQRMAQTNKMNTMTPLEAQELELKNKQYPELTKAKINSYNMGGMGDGVREEMMFQNLVAKDNPHLTPEQIYEASNVLRKGGDTLSDGTRLNPISPAARTSFDRLIKGSTTSGALTPLINAGQAETEIDALSKFAQEGLKPYNTTILNKSPDQIMDTFKNDDTSQKRLGKFIAAQQLQFEIAQNRIRLANGQPGVTSTQELMHLGKQLIDAKYPRLSGKAREEADRYMNEALKSGYEARKNAGVSASSILGNSKKVSENMKKQSDPLGIL